MACLNPNVITGCDCPSCSEEKTALNSKRNQVIYSGIPGPIVEWTLSDSWRTVPLASQGYRGKVTVWGNNWEGNAFQGEIFPQK